MACEMPPMTTGVSGNVKPFDLILIRGAPGVGKSTLLHGLKSHFPGGVCIEIDDLRNMINQVEWIPQPHNTECPNRVGQQILHSIEAGWGMSCTYRAHGYQPIILADTFLPDSVRKLEIFLQATRPPLSCHMVSLYCSDNELASRLRRRSLINRVFGRGKPFADVTASLQVNEYVRNHRYRDETFIDTTGISAAEILDAAVRALK